MRSHWVVFSTEASAQKAKPKMGDELCTSPFSVVNTRIMKKLLKADADATIACESGRTPLWCSARHEREQSFQTLLEWQCKRAREDVCNVADRNGATLLHVLCTTTRPVQMMILLMAEGADPTLLDINESPLIWLLRVLSANVKSKDTL